MREESSSCGVDACELSEAPRHPSISQKFEHVQKIFKKLSGLTFKLKKGIKK